MNYQNGKIYKIFSYQTDSIYVGSTAQPRLCNRMAQHKVKYNNYLKNHKNRYDSFEILKYDDAKIELIELYPCNTREELTAREGYWIRQLKYVNKKIPGRTDQQWRADNKDKIDIKNKKYYQDHQDQIKKRVNDYRETNKEKINEKKRVTVHCECGDKYPHANKCHHIKTTKHINWLNGIAKIDNSEARKQKKKLYNQQSIQCECGLQYTMGHKSRHMKSNKHIQFLENKKDI
jgi:hypothetical protein